MSEALTAQPVPTHISSAMGMYCPVAHESHFGTSASWQSGATPSANVAQYLPLWLPFPYPVRRMFWGNGSGIGSDHVDVGIYTADGGRIASTGGTVQSGASLLQYVDVTDFLLAPGNYWLAYVCDAATTTNKMIGLVAGDDDDIAMVGVRRQSTAYPLPATATFAASTADRVPLVGITQTTSGWA